MAPREECRGHESINITLLLQKAIMGNVETRRPWMADGERGLDLPIGRRNCGIR